MTESLCGLAHRADSLMSLRYNTSDVLEHKWRASLKTILFLYE